MRILLIEDGHGLVDFLAMNLKEHGDVSDVRNFKRARSEMSKMDLSLYGLVIMDCAPLSPSHLELCRDIRMQKKDLPILVVTPFFDEEDELAAFVVGASGYISKPFSIDELEIKIRTLTHKLANGSDKIFAAGDLNLDSLNKKVAIGTRIIQMTKKEFAILELLMSNFGRVVSRQKILESVWGRGRSTVSNIIDVHIKNLRRKLKFRNVPKIETSRAFGYRIREK